MKNRFSKEQIIGILEKENGFRRGGSGSVFLEVLKYDTTFIKNQYFIHL